MSTTTPISYGSAITTDSVATLESLGGLPTSRWQRLAFLIVSRDGSRRVLNVGQATLINLVLYPAYATKPLHSNPAAEIQRWDGCRLVALSMPRETGQQVLLWNQGLQTKGFPDGKLMVGFYVPYTGTPTAGLSAEPVNHIPLMHTLRSELSSIAAGWDIFWHSRYVFANHVRQQVVSRLVDGLLAYGWAEIAKVEAAARPGVNPAWKMETALTADIVRMAVGPITGRPCAVGAATGPQHRRGSVQAAPGEGRGPRRGHPRKSVGSDRRDAYQHHADRQRQRKERGYH